MTETVQPALPPRRRPGGLQAFWIAAIVLAAGAAFVIPFNRAPKIVEVMPGRGPAVKPRGWDETRAAFPGMEVRDRGAVVFAGDSITAWWKDLPGAFPGLKVANRGIAGDTSRTLLYRFDADILALEPKAMVLLIGTNDLHLGANPSDVAFNVMDMLDRLQRSRPDARVVLCAVMPRMPLTNLPPEKILDLNARLRAISSSRRGVTWCDSHTPFVTEIGGVRDEEFPDGLHPNEAAYAKWAESLRGAMKEAGIQE
ncbi:MAG: GDSL-type esterase/lipase family protein [Planctomycetota bacterium]